MGTSIYLSAGHKIGQSEPGKADSSHAGWVKAGGRVTDNDLLVATLEDLGEVEVDE